MSSLSERDLNLLTDRELYNAAKGLGIVYKGRGNAINDIKRKLKTWTSAVLPSALNNLTIGKGLRFSTIKPYDVVGLMVMSDHNLSLFERTWNVKGRCNIVKILTFGGKIIESDIILAMHPNFNDICLKLAGPNFQEKLLAMVNELDIPLTDPDESSKDPKVLLLEVLKRVPVTEPGAIDWKVILNYMLGKPFLVKDTFTYFGNYSTFNQLYLIMQLSTEEGVIQPVATAIEWQKMGATINIGERPYSIVVPLTDGRMMYSASVYLYKQTSLRGQAIRVESRGLSSNGSNFTVDHITKIAKQYLPTRLHKYLDTVVALVMWSFDPKIEIVPVTVPDSSVAISVIEAVSSIIQDKKTTTVVNYRP